MDLVIWMEHDLKENTSRARAGAGTYCLENETKKPCSKNPWDPPKPIKEENFWQSKSPKPSPKGDQLTNNNRFMVCNPRIIENLRKWKDEGWIKVQNADIFQKNSL